MAANMQVWLPVMSAPAGAGTGMSDLSNEQLDGVISQCRSIKSDLIAPAPLGRRETFLWALEEELQEERRGRAGQRPALRDFSVLIEGVAYGLLRMKTFDLHSYGFPFDRDDERYLSVLMFSTGPGAPESVAGFFAPKTLVCPAGNWTNRPELERQVQQARNEQAGTAGRGLLQVFQDTFPGTGTVWAEALRWFLTRNPGLARNASEANQTNIGPLLLELSPGAPPDTVYLPAFSKDRLPGVVHRLQGTSYETMGERIAVVHNDETLCTILLPQADRPKLFGLGSVEVTPGAELPARNNFDTRTLDLFHRSLEAVANGFSVEVDLPVNQRRFKCPDSIRAVIYSRGRWPFGDTSWIYSDQVLAAGFQFLPHQGPVTPGQTANTQEGIFHADPIPGDQTAFYIEEWNGRVFGELTALGSALWQVFRASKNGAKAEVERLIEVRRHLLIPLAGPVTLQDTRDARSWSDFLYWLDHQPSALLRAAAQQFAEKHGLRDVAPKKRGETAAVRIGQHDWRVSQ